MNIGEAPCTSSESQPALFWVVGAGGWGIQLGPARLRRVDTAADTAVTLSLSLSLALYHTNVAGLESEKYSMLIKASRLAITRS